MQPSLDDPLAVLQDLIPALDELRAPYLVGGSFASGIYGEFRATQDIDILCDFSAVSILEFVARLAQTFFIDDHAATCAVAESRSFNIFHAATAFKVDFFTDIGPFERRELERAVALQPFGSELKIMIASPEDAILAKLRWYQSGACMSERQWNDLLGVVRLQRGRIDIAYLEQSAVELGLETLLKKLLATPTI